MTELSSLAEANKYATFLEVQCFKYNRRLLKRHVDENAILEALQANNRILERLSKNNEDLQGLLKQTIELTEFLIGKRTLCIADEEDEKAFDKGIERIIKMVEKFNE